MRPRLVLQVRDRAGRAIQSIPTHSERVLRREIADRVLRMLVGVTERGGTAEHAALARYTVAGKTGTAQKVDPLTGGYGREHWVSSFVGLVPASKPRLTIAVVINEPAGDKYYGGDIAGPLFRRIASSALRYLGVEPDRAAPQVASNKRTTPAERQREARGARRDREPTPPPLPERRHRLGQAQVPDFTGMSIAEVIDSARKRGLRLRVEGSGRAISQSPGPGPATREALCRVRFSPPG